MEKFELGQILFKGKEDTRVPDLIEFRDWLEKPEQEPLVTPILERYPMARAFHPRAIGDMLRMLV